MSHDGYGLLGSGIVGLFSIMNEWELMAVGSLILAAISGYDIWNTSRKHWKKKI